MSGEDGTTGSFGFELGELPASSYHFHVYASSNDGNTGCDFTVSSSAKDKGKDKDKDKDKDMAKEGEKKKSASSLASVVAEITDIQITNVRHKKYVQVHGSVASNANSMVLLAHIFG